MSLMEIGRGDSQISRLTGIPRETIYGWRNGRGVYHRRVAAATPAWRPRQPEPYCYLLGVYLGDGCISVSKSGAASLIVTLDSSYQAVVAAVEAAMREVITGVPVTRSLRDQGSVTALRLSHPALPYAVPPHGPGRKHTRAIHLAGRQVALTHAHPGELLRGLIHSDGCRVINRFETMLPSGRMAQYKYPRYFFSNMSDDIRRIFCEHCDLLGVRWTQSNRRNISISHRNSVAVLDEFVGPKS